MSQKRSWAAYDVDDVAKTASHAAYATYGTPLPAFDSQARDDGSYVPIWKQEVTDERGRKRLHGAFTGGWSAGYFNTVGSKEGWTPSTFVSSRTNRATAQNGQAKIQRPEDFMDEEDLAEQAESQKLETQHSFAGLGSDPHGKSNDGMFGDMFRHTQDTIGVRLLQKMGWKPGQGVGSKVRRRADGDQTGNTHLFAPENSPMISFEQKSDRKGLGCDNKPSLEGSSQSIVGREEDDDDDDDEHKRDSQILRSNRQKAPGGPRKSKKSGFGVGVLQDTGSDDEDSYTLGPQLKYSRVIGGDKKKKKNSTPNGKGAPTRALAAARSQHAGTVLQTSSALVKCYDGQLPLRGFVLSPGPRGRLLENHHPPPAVPEGWESTKSATHDGTGRPIYLSSADAAKASQLDPQSRAALLGEEQLPGKSVFDFLSSAARDRIASATGNSKLPQALGEGAPAGFEANEADTHRTMWSLVPDLPKDTALAALHRGQGGWMPYGEDETKRARYRYFIELRVGLQSQLPDRPPGFSLTEWAKEMQEFAQAAEVFKPVSGLMASRFTTSSGTPQLASDAPSKSLSAASKTDDPSEQAAKMGMFGPLTRSTVEFLPTRLLCKRFGVRPPVSLGNGNDPAKPTTPVRKSIDIISQASLDTMMAASAHVKDTTNTSDTQDVRHARSASNIQNPRAVVDSERNDAVEGERAGEAVFKAIFGDEDSGNEAVH